MNTVSFKDPVLFTTVGSGEKLDTVVDVELALEDDVTEKVAELLGVGAEVVECLPPSSLVTAVAVVVDGAGSSLRSRPPTAKLAYRHRHSRAQTRGHLSIIFGVCKLPHWNSVLTSL